MEKIEKTQRDASHENIMPYNPEWANLYEAEAEKLREVFGEELLGIEHIGSTSVPGLSAKPIIDIMVLIDSHEKAEKYIPKLEANGCNVMKRATNSLKVSES